MQLTEHFHLSEFINSQTGQRLGIDNTPDNEVIENLIALAENVLEPVRAVWDMPVMISSGYRCPALNKAIGGAKSSQHVTGQAADIEVPGLDNCELAHWIADHLEFDQLILEFHDHRKGANDGWVHVSWNSAGNRNQVLTAVRENGKVVYLEGLD